MIAESAFYLSQTLQAVLGTVFFLAAVGKLRRPSRFVAAVGGYELVPSALIAPLSIGLMVTESVVSLSLLSGWLLDVGTSAAGALLLAFAAAISINLRRGRHVPCGCFGSAGERISGRTLVRLAMLILAATALEVLRLVFSPLPLNVVSLVTEGPRGVEQLAVTAGFAAFLGVVAAWILHIPELIVLVPRRRSEGDARRA